MAQLSGSEFKIVGRDLHGRPVQAYLTAPSYLDARRKSRAFARSRNFTVQSIQKKKVYAYRVVRGDRAIDGYQSAYSRSEVAGALKRLGFQVRHIRRHWDIRGRASNIEIVNFVNSSANLLEQKIPYNEVLQILGNNTRDGNLKAALREIINDLKNGVDSREAFARQGRVFGEHVALMLGIATKSGDMRTIFRSVSQLVERQAEFQKGLISALLLPAVTSLTLLGALVFYALYLLPKMAATMGPLVATMPPLTAMTLDISAFVRENLFGIIAFSLLTIGTLYGYLLTYRGRLFFDRQVVRLPYIGPILRNTSSEIFCRVLGILYTTGENIEAIQLAGEASGNRHLSLQIKTVAVPTMLKYGTELGSSLSATRFFPELFISRFKTAGETGTVKETAVQLAEYYQMQNHYSLKNLISFIEIGISVIIMLAMIFLTFLSSETASIDVTTFRR